MKRSVIFLLCFILFLVSCDNLESTETDFQGGSFSGPTSYTATLVCPEDESIDGKTVQVLWKQGFDFPTPKREHYKFGGWACGDDKLNSLDVWPYTHDAELVATWIPITYRIDYKLSPVMNNLYSNYNAQADDFYLPIPKPVKGHMFLGWTGEGITEPTKEILIPSGSAGNKVYTANWKNESDIAFKNDNGFAFEIIGDYAVIVGYFGEAMESLYLPSEYNGYPVKAVGKGALYGMSNSFEKLYIPVTVNLFEDYALGSGWAIFIEEGEPEDWLNASTFGKGNGKFSENNTN